MKIKLGRWKDKANNTVQIILVGILTGAFAGLVVTLFNVLVGMAEEFSRGSYTYVAEHPWFVPLLFAVLFLGAIVIGGVLKVLPMLRGSGFPQTEGATQGLLRFKWYEALTGMFASALFLVFMGLSAGAEGPSVMLGGACGDGMSTALRRNSTVRKFQITGGACAGLAVALNAPLTGMVFAYEEAHKRFTPEVFVCSFSSVVSAIVVRNLLRPALGLSVGPFLHAFSFPQDGGLFFLLYVLGAVLAVSLAGAAFYFAIFFLRKCFKKLTFWKGCGKYTIPFLLAGAAGLITVWAMGGGEELLEALGSKSEGTVSVFGAPLWASLLIILVIKFVATAVNTGADLPCCASIPMMAMGAILGRLFSLVFIRMGMPAELSDVLVVISMVTFFTTVVKAPITGILMTVEMTWSFTFLLPAVLGVAVGYLVSSMFRMEPMYERLLEEILKARQERVTPVTVTVRVTKAAGMEVRNILWPFTALATKLERGGSVIPPTGGTMLAEGDLLTVIGEPDNRSEFLAELEHAVGTVLSCETGRSEV